MKDFKIGIQLYSIRQALKEDFKGVCRELVKLGCDAVEPAFYFGDMEPEELAAFFKEIGLSVCGIHTRHDAAGSADSDIYRYCRLLNAPFVTLSYTGNRKTGIDYSGDEAAAIGICRAAGAAAAANNVRFTYHNHDLEFKPYPDGECGFDKLMAATDPAQVGAELDVYWVSSAGGDPLKYMQKYGRRIWQIHMKDMAEDGSITELGNGVIALDKCIEAAVDTNSEWLIYEQDYSNMDPFDSAVISLTHLRKLLKK